jgi:TPR repeat protein
MRRSEQLRVAAEAEAHCVRMTRLSRMSPAQLARVLAGKGTDAAPWIESAARYGVAEAQVRWGQLRLEAGEAAEALAWFERAAVQGSAEAMNMAGRAWENGWGAGVDLGAAALWYQRAAEAGSDWGQYNLGNLLFDGRGVAQDPVAAVARYREAAAQGHARAMNLLGRCCEEGWGVARDLAAARHWHRRSAEAGYFRAQYNHATWLAREGRLDEALIWFEQALAGATPGSRRSMTDAIAQHSDPRIASLAERFEAAA